MKCVKCGQEIIDEECSCPVCHGPMICEKGICHCDCGNKLKEDQCYCADCTK
ncbi:MAG TPA: hypothetical protein PLF71_02835 [bacterium]|nr:MAG: hypothetical protein BWY14_00051 [Parcubacteria group bacterium ADurb.Bin192]HPN15024.1 hypothetical protein [bacterium]